MPPSEKATLSSGYVRNAGPHRRSCAPSIEIWQAMIIRLSTGPSGASCSAAKPWPMCRHITSPLSISASKIGPQWSML